MDVYAQGNAIHAVLVGKPYGKTEVGVVHLFSADGGASWRTPSIINRAEDGKPISRRGNEAQVAAAGRRIVALWRQAGELPEAGPMVVAYSTDGGLSWRRGDNPAITDATQNQAYADLAADRAGRFHAVWLDDREENGNTQGLR